MIDTAEKRRSVAGISFFIFGPGVTPNVAQDLEWRQQSGWGYSGIAVGGIAAGAHVQCVITGGTLCNVAIANGTAVRVVIASPIKVTVLTVGGQTLKVTI